MDAISDRAFTEINTVDEPVDDPSLLTVILEITPKSWHNIIHQIKLREVVKSLLVFLNAHLAQNNSNLVSFITSGPTRSRFLYPNPEKNYDETINAQDAASDASDKEPSPSLINKGMYRQFRLVDEAVLQEFDNELKALLTAKINNSDPKSSLPGALSIALTYTNRMLTLDQSISTTMGSAINSTTKSASGTTSTANSSSSNTEPVSSSLTSMKSRILIVTANDDDNINYISIMNTIFAAQKMKLSIDVAKLGQKDSSYLQQASDATKGVYLHIQQPRGLIQTLCTAFFIEPSIRPLIILPTNTNVNYRASCFITGKSVDLGFVCSVCLCIISVIPKDDQCPTCKSVFDKKILEQLRRGPMVSNKKKRKLDTDVPGTPVSS